MTGQPKFQISISGGQQLTVACEVETDEGVKTAGAVVNLFDLLFGTIQQSGRDSALVLADILGKAAELAKHRAKTKEALAWDVLTQDVLDTTGYAEDGPKD